MADATQAPANAGASTQHTQNPADGPAGTYGYTREQQIEALHKLREPFDPSEIRFLPKTWCKKCTNSPGKACQDHPRRQCRTCGQSMNSAHIDLRFVGHAEATNRLLNVDPFWSWEPLSVDANGLPAYDGNRGLWIRLTVCGMTRLGYGHAGDKGGGDAVKEIIGDAIRNAGMRFGMALDLWTSSELQIIESGGEAAEEAPRAAAQTTSPDQDASVRPASDPVQDALLDKLMKQAANNWGHPLVLTQIRGEADAKGLLERQVQGPPPERAWMAFRELLDDRIGGLKREAAERGETERSAA